MNSPERGGAGHCAISVDDPEELVGGVKETIRGVKVQGDDVGVAEVDRELGTYLQNRLVCVKSDPALARAGLSWTKGRKTLGIGGNGPLRRRGPVGQRSR